MPILIFIGLGLILLGIAGILLLSSQAPGASLKDDIALVPAEVEYPAPDLALQDIQGEAVSLEGLRGQVVLVNLWATWCPPCKREMPALQAYYDRYKEKGFVIAAINDGDPTPDVVQFVEDYRLTFPVWLDPTYEATERAFKTFSLPSSFLIDRQGVIRLRWVGEIAAKSLEKYVTPIIME